MSSPRRPSRLPRRYELSGGSSEQPLKGLEKSNLRSRQSSLHSNSSKASSIHKPLPPTPSIKALPLPILPVYNSRSISNTSTDEEIIDLYMDGRPGSTLSSPKLYHLESDGRYFHSSPQIPASWSSKSLVTPAIRLPTGTHPRTNQYSLSETILPITVTQHNESKLEAAKNGIDVTTTKQYPQSRLARGGAKQSLKLQLPRSVRPSNGRIPVAASNQATSSNESVNFQHVSQKRKINKEAREECSSGSPDQSQFHKAYGIQDLGNSEGCEKWTKTSQHETYSQEALSSEHYCPKKQRAASHGQLQPTFPIVSPQISSPGEISAFQAFQDYNFLFQATMVAQTSKNQEFETQKESEILPEGERPSSHFSEPSPDSPNSGPGFKSLRKLAKKAFQGRRASVEAEKETKQIIAAVKKKYPAMASSEALTKHESKSTNKRASIQDRLGDMYETMASLSPIKIKTASIQTLFPSAYTWTPIISNPPHSSLSTSDQIDILREEDHKHTDNTITQNVTSQRRESKPNRLKKNRSKQKSASATPNQIYGLENGRTDAKDVRKKEKEAEATHKSQLIGLHDPDGNLHESSCTITSPDRAPTTPYETWSSLNSSSQRGMPLESVFHTNSVENLTTGVRKIPIESGTKLSADEMKKRSWLARWRARKEEDKAEKWREEMKKKIVVVGHHVVGGSAQNKPLEVLEPEPASESNVDGRWI